MSNDRDPPTPRFTPFVRSAPIFRALAEDWAKRLDKEAASVKELMPNRTQQCSALAMRMRALALEFAAIDLCDPGNDHRLAIRARWIEALDAARGLLPNGEFS